MGQLCDLGALNEETYLKTGIYAKKLSKIDPVENFDFWSKVNAKVDKQKLNLIARKVNGLQFGSDLRTSLVCVW